MHTFVDQMAFGWYWVWTWLCATEIHDKQTYSTSLRCGHSVKHTDDTPIQSREATERYHLGKSRHGLRMGIEGRDQNRYVRRGSGGENKHTACRTSQKKADLEM